MHTGRISRVPADRRRLIVRVAGDEFARAGYDVASLNRIITDCGMSKSSFYYLFESKRDLFDFVVREILTEVGELISVPEAEDFAGHDFWWRVEGFFFDLVAVSQRAESALTLGRMFYGDAPAGAQGTVTGTLEAVRSWVEQVLAVGRRCGAVRDDLPEALQSSLVFRILQVFDEWTVSHYDEFAPAELNRLAEAQFATVRRVLEP